MNKILFFDYDGTLVDEKENIHMISETMKNTLKELQKQGHKIVLCTGRALSYVPLYIFDLNFDAYISSNGAYVEVDHKELTSYGFTKEECCTFIQEMKDKNCLFFLEGNRHCFMEKTDDEAFKKFIEHYDIPTDRFTEDFTYDEVISKFTVFYKDKEDMKHYFKQKDFNGNFHNYGSSCDMVKKGISKAKGMQAICDYFHIDMKDTIAFGDGSNDVEMLKSAGIGVMMKKHHISLEKVADDCCDSVKNEGITKFLYKNEILK